MAANHTVVAVDLRGVGRSALEKTGYDKETLATDVHQLVGRLGLGEVTLVGDDFRGQVAYAYARMHRNEVRSLVAIEAALPGFSAFRLRSQDPLARSRYPEPTPKVPSWSGPQHG